MKLYGMEYLRSKLGRKYTRCKRRYDFYEMKQKKKQITALIPPEFRSIALSLGWCSKAVDSMADRLQYDGFDNDDFRIGEIYTLNNDDVLMDNAILSALITSCSFLHIDRADGYPAIECIDGRNATGIIDPTTNMLAEGYAVLESDEYGNAVREAYFLPYETQVYENGKLADVLEHDAPYPLLVPVINRPDAKRPFGHSRISRACMAIVESTMRTMLRSEVGAEFYSIPQKYVVGLSQDADFNNKAASFSSFLNFTKDEDGDVPQLGQFSQQSMTPHMEHMRMLASMFAGETGLTLDDLGFTSGNPASFDAIRASHEQLRLACRKAQRTFGVGFLNAGYLAACVRDKKSYDRRAFAGTKTAWSPIFEPDAAALGALGDAVAKINGAVEGYIGSRSIYRMTGIEGESNGL